MFLFVNSITIYFIMSCSFLFLITIILLLFSVVLNPLKIIDMFNLELFDKIFSIDNKSTGQVFKIDKKAKMIFYDVSLEIAGKKHKTEREMSFDNFTERIEKGIFKFLTPSVSE